MFVENNAKMSIYFEITLNNLLNEVALTVYKNVGAFGHRVSASRRHIIMLYLYLK